MAADRMSVVVSWPEEYGGRNAPAALGDLRGGVFPVGRPGPGQPERYLPARPNAFRTRVEGSAGPIMPRMARADDIWGQAWSEPESGSDLASLRSTATRTEGGWLLNGQKTWSSRSSFADWAFGLFRSDRDAQRHKGITYFMFDLRSPGVTVRPIAQLDGEPGFAELFLENVFVPDDPANPAESGVIGEVNNGWRVAMSTAANERGLSLRALGRFLATTDRLVDLWKRNRTEVPAAADVDRRVADAWIGSRAYELSTYQTVSRLAAGGQLGMESSINKVFWSQGTSPPRRPHSTCRAPTPRSPTNGPTVTCSRCLGRSTPVPMRFSAM